MRTVTRHQPQWMLAPTLVLAGFVRAQMNHPISRSGKPIEHIAAHLTHQYVGIPLSRAHHAHQRPISELWGQILTEVFERPLAVLQNHSDQHPAKDPEMTRLDTAKNGLERVEHLVYVDGNACERPHGLDSCVILGFGHLPRYTGVLIFQVLVADLSHGHPSATRHF